MADRIQIVGLINRIDNGLKIYYSILGRNDYVNCKGIGKFKQWINEQSWRNDKYVREDLNNDRSLMVYFDLKFPHKTSIDDWVEWKKQTMMIIKKIASQGTYMPPLSVQWHHITNALKQELYDNISRLFSNIVNQNRYTQTMNINEPNIETVLSQLKIKVNIAENEINYIKALIRRAILLKPLTKAKITTLLTANEVFTNDELTLNTLYDIYNVYKCFLFANYQFKRYEEKEFIHLIENNYYCKNNNIKISKITPEQIPTISLFPQYVIDDDMYAICRYFFVASHVAHELLDKNYIHLTENKQCTIKVIVITNRIVSIYDKEITFEYNMNDLNAFFTTKQCNYFVSFTMSAAESETVSSIHDVYTERIKAAHDKEHKIGNLLIVIDRRESSNDYSCNKIYMLSSETDLNDEFSELDSNYFISLQIKIKDIGHEMISQCHLFYGVSAMDKIRFYPEYLTTIIPRLFCKKDDLTAYERMQKRYDDHFKHGFSFNLQDAIFDKYYKIITGWTHISVNYNRKMIKMEDEKEAYEYNDDSQHKKLNEKSRICNSANILEIQKCGFVQYIIESLIIFENDNHDIHKNINEFNLQLLSKCYDHIICIHSFCRNNEQRNNIKTYVRQQVKKCEIGQQCHSLQKHSSRKRETKQPTKHTTLTVRDPEYISFDILQSCLISLHCYLLHDGDTLYRLHRN
eukprot:133171_1